jgi:hypothetical protein
MASRRVRLTIAFAAVVVVALGAIWAGTKLWRSAQNHFTATQCTIGDYELDTDQASVAAEMVGAVSRYTTKAKKHLPERAAVLALAAGLQESKLRNLASGDGDRDSVGVLQQRPSQGWGGGDPARLNDVTEATREFLDALVTHKGWQHDNLAHAIQAVQISADGSAYAQHEVEAQALADALQGHRPAGISCTFDKPTVVASTTKVVTLLRAQVPVTTPTATGLVIRVPGAAWQAAAWFIANADRLGIDSVAYAGKRWSRSDGWQSASSAVKTAVVATMAKISS